MNEEKKSTNTTIWLYKKKCTFLSVYFIYGKKTKIIRLIYLWNFVSSINEGQSVHSIKDFEKVFILYWTLLNLLIIYSSHVWWNDDYNDVQQIHSILSNDADNYRKTPLIIISIPMTKCCQHDHYYHQIQIKY